MTPNSNVSYLFSRLGFPGFETTFFQTLNTMIDWLIEWVIAWLIDWLIDWLIEWLIDWLIDWLTDWLTAGFGYGRCTAKNDRSTKWTKITLKLIVLVQKFDCFQLTYSYSIIPIIVWTYSTMKIHKDQRHQKPTIYWSLLRFYLLFTLTEWYQL